MPKPFRFDKVLSSNAYNYHTKSGLQRVGRAHKGIVRAAIEYESRSRLLLSKKRVTAREIVFFTNGVEVAAAESAPLGRRRHIAQPHNHKEPWSVGGACGVIRCIAISNIGRPRNACVDPIPTVWCEGEISCAALHKQHNAAGGGRRGAVRTRKFRFCQL